MALRKYSMFYADKKLNWIAINPELLGIRA